jgi:hypothetical protein
MYQLVRCLSEVRAEMETRLIRLDQITIHLDIRKFHRHHTPKELGMARAEKKHSSQSEFSKPVTYVSYYYHPTPHLDLYYGLTTPSVP